MAVRMMTYVGLLYQDLIRSKDILPHRKLPPVLPIVLYNGDAKWTAATDVAALIPKVPGLVSQYMPKLEYLLIDQSQYTEADLSELENLVAAVIRFEHSENPTVLLRLIDLLSNWLEGNPELKRTFAIWIRAVLLRQSKSTLVLPQVQDLKELKMTLAKSFDAWAQQHEQKGIEQGIAKGIEQGIEKGIEKGIAQGESVVLQRQLARRFGPLPTEVVAQIAAASVDEIELWCDRVLDAASLDDVFQA